MGYAAAVLAEDDPAQAQRMIGEALITLTRAETAAQVTLSDSDPDWARFSLVVSPAGGAWDGWTWTSSRHFNPSSRD